MSLRSRLEPSYVRLLQLVTAGRGVAWDVDAQTRLRIDPRCRWIRNPSYEAAVVEYLRARIQPGECCVDVGAHVGFYALQMALWTGPAGRVIAFEPNPVARDVLEANIGLNGLKGRIAVEPMAISNTAGTGELFHAMETTGLSRLGAPNVADYVGRPLTVDVTTLDAYCSTHPVVPQWVLIDAEGFEPEVLEGAMGLLRDERVSFVVEVHPALWPDESRAAVLERVLRACGRRAVALTGQKHVLADYGTIALLPARRGTAHPGYSQT